MVVLPLMSVMLLPLTSVMLPVPLELGYRALIIVPVLLGLVLGLPIERYVPCR
ncbi:hypothetical protein CALVIDRAFT_541151 [Calocera viscosa TUFC12733]|uniref:Uncharacterized protein n=1 Tax=Calocera viscosa (strain TUFC12733) TaxID=1330018 RepID=A0A167HZA4_CALVF|nr:hypothetical protein CALVIDRAFT_541151 [Calocera viscosa TUFC12733]